MPLDSRPWAIGSPLDVVRSVAFYLAFYLGSVPYVIGAALAMPVAERLFQRIVTGWSAYHRFCARWLLGIQARVEGEIPTGPVIIALRHESFFEAIDLPTLLDDPVIVAKAELMQIPLWGMAARRWGLIAVRRDEGAKALRAMVAEAKARIGIGRPLAIFPEGTRVAAGEEGDLQSGFAALYKLLKLPVVPVAVNSGRLYHRWFKRPGTVTYRFGEAIPPGLPRDEIEARVKAAITVLNKARSEGASRSSG